MIKFFMRFLGTVNLLFVGLGVWYAVGMRSERLKAGKWPPYSAVRLDWFLYFALLASCIALIIWFCYLSVRLIRADRKALLPTCIVFGVEIGLVWAEVAVFWFPGFAPEWAKERHWFWIQGWDLVVPQIALGYVFVGLLASLVLLLITRPWKNTSQTVPHFSS
jgi:hypothetical protein